MTPPSGETQKLLSTLPSVDELLKSPSGSKWLSEFKRKIVLQAVREVISSRRNDLREGRQVAVSPESLEADILERIGQLSSYSLIPVINATGIVVHTNLGRAILSEKALENVLEAGRCYTNLEFDLEKGKRGKRHTHTKRLLRQIMGAEDAFIVNNNAAAVFLCLNTLAKGREVIVSRGELVEIGGSFRVPDVMAASGAVLREVGTTNKTHLRDYINGISENTALILKVHQSNYRIMGFTEDVPIADLVSLGKRNQIPVMYDLGSGCLIDLKSYGVHSEPSAQEVIKAGVDIITFSGDKLFGGPQAGVIAGGKQYVEAMQKNPLARALRVDKLTIAAFEATLMEYLDAETAAKSVPVLAMLFQPLEEIRGRANRMAAGLRRALGKENVKVVRDSSKAGGGSLPEIEFPTFAVSLQPHGISVNELEARLRNRPIPVIGRIKDRMLLLDARTVRNSEISEIIEAVLSALKEQ